MSKKPRFKIQRRLSTELPGLGKAGALQRRAYPPGEKGNRRRKYSDYTLRLEEKQKVRFHYGLREEQLRRFIRDAKKGQATTAWVNKLAGRLERRLDNIVFRLGFATSIPAARQLVSHGHVMVNGKKASIPSMVLKENDEISLKESSYENQIVLQAQQSPRLEVPDYLKKEDKGGKPLGKLIGQPGLEHIPFNFDSGLLTEYYAARKV